MNFHKFRVMMLAAIISQAVACCNPEQKFEVKVKDEGGKPLEGIVCKVGFNLPKKEETGISPYIVSGVTPANGSVEIPGETDVDFRRNFYFRTRTVTDAAGNIISAHYGKIYGDFQFNAARKDWGYLSTLALVTTYFNPTSNDRNVEFDPKRNLLPNGNVRQP